MPNKNKLTVIEKKIMRVLYQQKVPLTYYEIAKEAGISYTTAKNYVDKLVQEGIIQKKDGRKEKKKT